MEELIVLFPIIIFVIVVTVIVAMIAANAKKKMDAQKSAADYRAQMDQRQNTDNNVSQRARNASRAKTVNSPQNDAHTHLGEEEHYEKIVGSLGEVDDEGCADLDGIRLIAHDEAYDGETQSRNYSEIVKAIVLGEVLDKPGFKKHR